jgi:hypothetical protein
MKSQQSIIIVMMPCIWLLEECISLKVTVRLMYAKYQRLHEGQSDNK